MALLSELGLPPIEPAPEQSFAHHQLFEAGAIGLFVANTSKLVGSTRPSVANTRGKQLDTPNLRIEWSRRADYDGPFSLHDQEEWDETIAITTTDDTRQAALRLQRNRTVQNVMDFSEDGITAESTPRMITEASLNLAIICNEYDVVRALFSSVWTGWNVTKVLNGAATEGHKKLFLDHYTPSNDERTILVDAADLIVAGLQTLSDCSK